MIPAPRGRLHSLWVNTRHSLHFKISLLVVLLVLAIVGTGTAVSLRAIGNAMYATQSDLARQWGTSLAAGAADALASDNRDEARRQLEHNARALTRWRAVAYVAFADENGNVIVSTEARPGLLASVYPPDGRRIPKAVATDPHLLRDFAQTSAAIEVLAPVYASTAQTPQSSGRGILGYVLLGTDASITQARFTRIANGLLALDFLIVLLVIPGTFLLTRHIVSPLNQLARAARALANGVTDARAPVRSRNEIGQLANAFNQMANRITRSQMELLQLAAELEQRVEERTRELEDLASKDPLTGLYNRRHFSEVMAREFAAAERYGSDLTCLMFDLDHFKQINDQLGHRTGDEVLLALGHAITSELRGSDVAARFGGDEFILLLPQTSAVAARSLADRVSHSFAERAAARFPKAPAGLSVGIASLNTTRARNAEVLVNEADRALYIAKETGRGRIVEAPPAVVS